ncbi:hypothetical protein DICPUDRAFT_154873 [Dictyostelium purpureum]|uniref:tRNA-splicing endonuclease subunit Sen15 domain-containing protein n=1 Tax=Dictyostelium purpureum TaxID=5786 RepID=F0ZSI0_DICPU|nr:uncharacterized protein DICPUDRAFT_154873 [Dictyostelium purpureum]EGC33106.1 hypothetical protein DICPUDRAFT_154873 [Dictyostelium purpureum]|eukprot:XP_003290383.1 hypothetical protein DICPUDRAFT_154873 [Dictyostelium purpureum]
MSENTDLDKILNDLQSKYSNKFRLDQIHLAFQIYIDLFILKKWESVEFKNNKDLIFIYAIEKLENLNNYNIVIPCKSTSIWSLENLKETFYNLNNNDDNNNLNNNIPIDCKSFTLGIIDDDSSISYYELSYDTGLSDILTNNNK